MPTKMKRNIFLVICLVAIACTSVAQTDTVLSRYKQYLFANLNLPANTQQLIASLDKNGQWTDINYQDAEKGGWKPLNHVKRIRDLALVYANPRSSFYHRAFVGQSIGLALDHWIEKRYKCPNWWHNEIGVPQQIRDIIILMDSSLTPQRLKGALEILNQYQVHKNSTGANLTWSADLGLHYGLVTNDIALAKKCRDLIVEEIKITTDDGVQPDYSFHQHDKRLQMYQYGGAFLIENVRLAWELRATSLAFPKDKIQLLTDFTLQGWQWMTRGINTVPGTMDRSASRKDALHSSDIRQILPYLIDIIPGYKKELTAIAEHQNNKGSLVGFRYFPLSDFAAYQQPGFSFFVKTISERTLATESINSENLKGHLLNSGDAYFIHDGNEYFNLMPVWNWEYLPGVTSFKGAEKIKRKSFGGSVSDGGVGVTSMDYMLVSNNASRYISAKKSWFCFDDKVVCLIADLKGQSVDSAYTAMDQCRWDEDVTIDKRKSPLSEGNHQINHLKWVQHGGFVYMPLNVGQTEIQLHSDTGKWTTINAGESDATVQDKIFMPVLNTGLSKAQSFGYVTAYSKTSAEAKKIAKRPGFKILRNDSVCQAVSFSPKTLMTAFFEPSTVVFNKQKLSVDKPCLVLIRDGKMYVSDPQQFNSPVTIQLNGKTFHVQLPNNGFTSDPISLK